MKKVSIIIPVYNAENYIDSCIRSVLSQEYPMLELILVNDGSTDKSINICTDYASRDERVLLINKKNGGVSSARNAGINAATGDYIAFVDSDDQLPTNVLDIMVRKIAETNADVLIGSYVKCFQEKKVSESISECYIEGKKNIAQYFENHFREGIASSVWAKLYRRKLITKGFDESMSMAEDLLFNIGYFSKINSIAAIQTPVYMYNQTNESSLVSTFKIGNYEQTVKACEEMMAWLDRVGYKCSGISNVDYKMADNLYTCMIKISQSNLSKESKVKYLQELSSIDSVRTAVKNVKKVFRFHQIILFDLLLTGKNNLCLLYAMSMGLLQK